MKMNLKRFFPFLICFCLFFLLVDDVSASSKTFKLDEDGNTGICYDSKTFKILGVGLSALENCAEQNHDGTGKRYAEAAVIKTSDGKIEAYCADKDKVFRTGKNNNGKNWVYAVDDTFSNSKKCIYYNGNTRYTNGDCSEILGFIIDEGRNYGNESDDLKKWFNAQGAVWIYLGKYAPSPYKDGNDSLDDVGFDSFGNPNINTDKIWENSHDNKIQKIIKEAWGRYHKSLNYLTEDEKDDISISITDNDKKFYYIPNGDTCGGGAYVTKPIKITNRGNKSVKLSVGHPAGSDRFSICDNDNGSCKGRGESFTFTLGKNQTKTIKFATSYTFAGEVKFQVSTNYEGDFTHYDSLRYINDKDYQSVVIPSDGVTSFPFEHALTFTQVSVTHRKCPNSVEYINEKDNIWSQSTTPVKKKCANKVLDNGIEDEEQKEYQVKFSGCNCTTIDLKNGGKVNVLLYENVGFQFGTLTPTKLYPGGGFQFSINNNGISTIYQSKITWRYADYVNGSGYYYNPNNIYSNKITKELEKEINDKIKVKLKNEIISLNISTLDSNNAKDSKTNKFKISLNFDSIDFDSNSKVFTVKVSDIKMNKAYFSVDGTVKYENIDRFSIDGGNKYYVPVHYVKSSFPFDIVNTNLSALPDMMNFYYEAVCDVKIDGGSYLYGNDGVRYRSINLSNPFPKANVPYNWQEWYWNNVSNKVRLKNTFQRYPSAPLYGININTDKLNKIGNLTDFYTSWSNIKVNGSSEFVLDNEIDFYKYANNSSYCNIGEFSTECDK